MFVLKLYGIQTLFHPYISNQAFLYIFFYESGIYLPTLRLLGKVLFIFLISFNTDINAQFFFN